MSRENPQKSHAALQTFVTDTSQTAGSGFRGSLPTIQPLIDERATPEQRDALLQIPGGQHGGTFFEILASIVTTFLGPQFVSSRLQALVLVSAPPSSGSLRATSSSLSPSTRRNDRHRATRTCPAATDAAGWVPQTRAVTLAL
ncbi:DUF1326 domain-containing protein [Paraburkholderia sp. GAS448]|uniref:DUF1326 domain-containing protein n=1 Tax=Paraburkholderia sp. GAS448 TaxID=3035136 RepID=UPI003D1C6EB5